jgi:hypothetical protein
MTTGATLGKLNVSKSGIQGSEVYNRVVFTKIGLC